MKIKIFIFSVLISFVLAIVAPIILIVSMTFIHHHDMTTEQCIEHCIVSKSVIDHPRIISIGDLLSSIPAIKFVLTLCFIFVLPLSLIYIFRTHAPPNIFKNIKNYTYHQLVGVMKLIA